MSTTRGRVARRIFGTARGRSGATVGRSAVRDSSSPRRTSRVPDAVDPSRRALGYRPGRVDRARRDARRRGGYCFHLNGGLSQLLRGSATTSCSMSAVCTDRTARRSRDDDPLVLTVHDLPTAANPSGVWYVDAGLGDALHEPLPLRPGVYEQGPFRLSLEQTIGVCRRLESHSRSSRFVHRDVVAVRGHGDRRVRAAQRVVVDVARVADS